MRLALVTGSDDRMDCREMFYDPINPLPVKCATCGFPDLDHVPVPYFLVKSRTMSPNEFALAENGNFFVRERVRRALELLAPGQVAFFSTCFQRSSQETPWFLAVPNHQVVTAKVNPTIQRCSICNEPRSAHPGTQWTEWLFSPPESDFDVVKSLTWGSSDRHWKEWICRDLYMSIRLLHLLKRIKAAGFYEAGAAKPTRPNQQDSAWIIAGLQILESNGIPMHPAGTLSDQDARWFRDYLKSHAKSVSKCDLKGLEKKTKVKLPKSYVAFISKVGPMTFENVDQQEGFTVHVLRPDEMDFAAYRKGALEIEHEESRAIDGVMFATTDHGDCFCFDVQKGKKEYPVLFFKHEGEFFEPYAENFATCIKRFAGD